jgi:hypothetical protein
VNIVIFLGPTLSHAEALPHLEATYLPPVAQGDVFRASKERPSAIGIVDGYFERLPAVWHKEILWALSEGIHVFGAASMGALRPAELATFGMRGVGAIYEAFHSGVLEDDDEVAVAHGDASTGYRATSEAMVNVRATLRCAEQDGIATAMVRGQLEAIAKRLFYPDRSYARVFSLALEQGMPAREVEALRTFVFTHRVDQKRVDALALLDAVKRCCEEGAQPSRCTFSLAHTEAWERVVDWAETQPPLTKDSESVPAGLLAAEVRLSGANGPGLFATGLNRAVAAVLARRIGVADLKNRVGTIDAGLRQSHGAGEERGFDRWLEMQGLTRDTYDRFLEGKAELDWLRERFRDEVDRYLVDEVRLSGQYARLSQRARDKQNLLTEKGLDDPAMRDAGLDMTELLSWYFEQRIGRPVPSDLDLEGVLLEIGLADAVALKREALREFLYLRLSAADK